MTVTRLWRCDHCGTTLETHVDSPPPLIQITTPGVGIKHYCNRQCCEADDPTIGKGRPLDSRLSLNDRLLLVAQADSQSLGVLMRELLARDDDDDVYWRCVDLVANALANREMET